MVDKNLFLHDLAVVAILKNEAPYLKEWLDYHLFAGVDHFYLYDNDSEDNQAEVAAPYVEAGLVDYIHAPGKMMQYLVYNDAVKNFKFQSRYMAFIDGDEFIFPTRGGGISEVVDDVLAQDPDAAGLAINWQIFGSNGEETADLSRGVLERFTRRAEKDWFFNYKEYRRGNVHIKTVANPRVIDFIDHPHYPTYFEGACSVNENGEFVPSYNNDPVTVDKIAVHHYYAKSHEEFTKKLERGSADHNTVDYETGLFEQYDRNEVFDDGILKYRDERAKTFRLPDKSRADERLLNALMMNLSPTLFPNTPKDFYRGKFETFLTCRAVAAYLNEKFGDDIPTKFFEEAALNAIMKTFSVGVTLGNIQLLIRELPDLLKLPYPVVEEIRNAARQFIEQLKSVMHVNARWKDFVELNYLQEFLKE